MRLSAIFLLVLTVPAFSDRSVVSADCAGKAGCCELCGRQAVCYEKCCQMVCEMKKETKTCWCVESQEICTLLPGCHHDCDECPLPPRCGRTKCVKKLVKKEYQVETPVYKCVVRHLSPSAVRTERQSLPPRPLRSRVLLRLCPQGPRRSRRRQRRRNKNRPGEPLGTGVGEIVHGVDERQAFAGSRHSSDISFRSAGAGINCRPVFVSTAAGWGGVLLISLDHPRAWRKIHWTLRK